MYFQKFYWLKNYTIFANDLPFLPQRMKIETIAKFVVNLHDKKNMSYTLEI